ncbi:unnamed protein product [Echinostoma caproni]|uniref:Cadherin domain-containing protein n=1 Tax=Echinostoma caproni TaxID=27848 RepID=A0A3P8GX29_9TREM|nr:unnamed protein product [Echinostoma caproni]
MPAGAIVGKVTAYAALDLDRGRENRLGDDTGMCNYAIDHPDNNVFDINGHGVIRSRISLEHYSAHRFTINVTGFDCHVPVRRRSTVRVNVHVRPDQVAQSNGKLIVVFTLLPAQKYRITQCFTVTQVDLVRLDGDCVQPELVYTALPRAHWVSPNATLKTCDNQPVGESATVCKPTEATLRVKLLWSGDDDDDVDEGKEDSVDSDDSAEDGDPNYSLSDTDSSSVCDFDRLSVRAHSQSCEESFVHSTNQTLAKWQSALFNCSLLNLLQLHMKLRVNLTSVCSGLDGFLVQNCIEK